MAISLFAPSRTVLLISDEALYIYSSSARSTRLIEVVDWEEPVFVDKVSDILRKDCGGRPVLFLNDMVEQHYRKERVPNVGLLDKQNVIRRKLKVAFPSHPIRAALELKEKTPRTEQSRPGRIYIFASLPESEAFKKAMEAVRKSLCSVAGFGLVPVESAGLVKKISDNLPSRGQSPVWTVFMGQHVNGGLRQIVTKNGELALTRMTPIGDFEDDPHDWAKDVHQEFKATMSYLGRFGFRAEDGLNVIVITNQNGGDILGDMIDIDCNFLPMGVNDAANTAGIQIGPQKNQRFADALHAAWSSKKTKPVLPMRAPELETISRPRQVAMLATFALVLGAAFQGYQLLDSFQVMQTVASDLDSAQSRERRLSREYDEEVARKEALGFDVRLVQSAVSVYEDLEAREIKSLNLVAALGRALGRDLRMDQLTIDKAQIRDVPEFLNRRRRGGGDEDQEKEPAYSVNFQMTFPSTTDIDRGNQEVADLRDRIAALLPDHNVNVEKFLRDYEFIDELVVETGRNQDEDLAQDFVASIRIEGPPR